MVQSSGKLLVVSTPIGNLEDLSQRAKQALSDASYVLCESIEQTRKLGVASVLRRYEGKGVQGDHQRQQVIADVSNGQDVALVSNAGTPLMSDPGQSLVTATVKAGLTVMHIPGQVAAISAAVTSGLPTKNLIYMGFLSKKSAAIKDVFIRGLKALEAIEEPASLVVYCSKYQILKTIKCIQEIFGKEASVSIAREMTKLHEEHFTGRAIDATDWLNQSPHRLKGEFTLVVSLTGW